MFYKVGILFRRRFRFSRIMMIPQNLRRKWRLFKTAIAVAHSTHIYDIGRLLGLQSALISIGAS